LNSNNQPNLTTSIHSVKKREAFLPSIVVPSYGLIITGINGNISTEMTSYFLKKYMKLAKTPLSQINNHVEI